MSPIDRRFYGDEIHFNERAFVRNVHGIDSRGSLTFFSSPCCAEMDADEQWISVSIEAEFIGLQISFLNMLHKRTHCITYNPLNYRWFKSCNKFCSLTDNIWNCFAVNKHKLLYDTSYHIHVEYCAFSILCGRKLQPCQCLTSIRFKIRSRLKSAWYRVNIRMLDIPANVENSSMDSGTLVSSDVDKTSRD